MLTITDAAKAKIAKVLRQEGQDRVFHVSVRAGGCNGFQYVLYVSKRPACVLGTTRIFSAKGPFSEDIYVDGKSWELLDGTTLDYEPRLVSSRPYGFSFDNPKASSTCGCGLSFASI